MATRSTIALEYADGHVKAVYCHWDGYLSHNGQILHQHYQDRDKVKQLVELGQISSLAEDVGEKHDFDDRIEGWTTFYGRDRGETDVSYQTFPSFKEYEANGVQEEYDYILRTNGIWYVRSYSGSYTPLADALAAELIAEELAEDE